MIDNVLRAPRNAGEVVADGVRMLVLVSIVVAAIRLTLLDALSLTLLIPAVAWPRALGVRPSFDIAYCTALLVASWSSLLDLYSAVGWLDLVVHFATNGLIAAMIYVFAVSRRAVPDPLTGEASLATVTLLTVAFGLAAGTLWEFAEWLGHNFISEGIVVGYDDSIGDLAVGGLGSVLAGLAMRFLAARPQPLRARTAAARSSAR